MAALVAGTVHAVASTSQIISGAYELSRKLLEVLRPWCARLDSEDVHYIYCIQRQIECLIRPLEFCMLWSRHRDAVSQQTILLVEDTLRRVWTRIRRLDQRQVCDRVPPAKFVMNNTAYGDGAVRTCGKTARTSKHSHERPSVTLEPLTRSVPVYIFPADAVSGTDTLCSSTVGLDWHGNSRNGDLPQAERTSQTRAARSTRRSAWGRESRLTTASASSILRWCVEELHIATSQLTLTLTTIQAYRNVQGCSKKAEAVSSDEQVSPATLLKACRHLFGMTGRTGDVCLCRGSLMCYKNDETLKKNNLLRKPMAHWAHWQCIYSEAFLRIAKRQPGAAGQTATIIIDSAAETSFRGAFVGEKDPSEHIKATDQPETYTSDDPRTVATGASWRREILANEKRPRADQCSSLAVADDDFWFVADQYGPDPSTFSAVQQHFVASSPSHERVTAQDAEHKASDEACSTLEVATCHVPTALQFPIEMAMSMRLQPAICPHVHLAEQLSPTSAVESPENRSFQTVAKTPNGPTSGPALVWEITRDDLGSFLGVTESAWLHTLIGEQSIPGCIIQETRNGETPKSRRPLQLMFAFVFESENQDVPKGEGVETEHNVLEKRIEPPKRTAIEPPSELSTNVPTSRSIASSAGVHSLYGTVTSSTPTYSDPLTPLEILYVARLYFLETAMARTPSSTGLLERWMSAQYSSSSRRQHDHESSIWGRVSDEVLVELLSGCFVD